MSLKHSWLMLTISNSTPCVGPFLHNSSYQQESGKTIFDIGETLTHTIKHAVVEIMYCIFTNLTKCRKLCYWIVIMNWFSWLAGGVQSAFQSLKEYEVQLKSIVRKRFDAAVELKNSEEVIRSLSLTHTFISLFLFVCVSFLLCLMLPFLSIRPSVCLCVIHYFPKVWAVKLLYHLPMVCIKL